MLKTDTLKPTERAFFARFGKQATAFRVRIDRDTAAKLIAGLPVRMREVEKARDYMRKHGGYHDVAE